MVVSARSRILSAQNTLTTVVAASKPPSAPEASIVRLPNDRVRITIGRGSSGPAPADIWLVAYDPGPITVVITAGANLNRTVDHYNLVLAISRIDQWDGAAKWLERANCDPECAVLVQEPNGGVILSAASTRRPTRN